MFPRTKVSSWFQIGLQIVFLLLLCVSSSKPAETHSSKPAETHSSKPAETYSTKPADRGPKQSHHYYTQPCNRSDPNINECLAKAANAFVHYLKNGIIELGVNNMEPIVIDEIHLALGSGSNGYRATFKDITAYGVSNMSVVAVRSDISSNQYQFTFEIPMISVRGHYRSSGVLIMVPATGGGEYWGEYENIRAKIYLKASEYTGNTGKVHLKTEDLKMDFTAKNLQMGIEKVQNGNEVLEAALNLFINSNAQDLLKEMKPDIKKKLLHKMKMFLDDHLFRLCPLEEWLV